MLRASKFFACDSELECSAFGNLLRSYTYGQGIDAVETMTLHGRQPSTYTFLRDQLNSVVGLVDESGTIVESYDYDAFGNITVYNAEGIEINRSAFGNRYTFQGREIDWDTGLYNFRARWYDAETGRWISKDPLGIAGGLNLYEAFGNNPVNFIDPFGLEKKKFDEARLLSLIRLLNFLGLNWQTIVDILDLADAFISRFGDDIADSFNEPPPEPSGQGYDTSTSEGEAEYWGDGWMGQH